MGFEDCDEIERIGREVDMIEMRLKEGGKERERGKER